MSKEKILIIEDEKNIAELLQYNLESEGYAVSVSSNGDDGLEKAIRTRPDLVVLDLMLPGMSGLDVCKTLRSNNRTANMNIIMLTAKGEEIDKVIGLEVGADDYVSKPFSPRELLARIKALLRRTRNQFGAQMLSAGQLDLDSERHLVTLKGKRIDLTSKEYDLLKALMEANGRVLSREQLLNNVWGYENSLNIETRTVDMHIGQLRKKLKSEAERVITVKNAGYRFDHEL